MCGPVRCCTRFPSHEQPITLRMAKDQDVPMNPGRITGLCGRLRCCLAFEHPVYRSFRDRAPAVGRMVKTPQGRGIVRNYKVLDDKLVDRARGTAGRGRHPRRRRHRDHSLGGASGSSPATTARAAAGPKSMNEPM